MFTGQEAKIGEELNKRYYSDVNKKYTFTTKASGRLSEVQNFKKEEFENKLNDGKNIGVNQRTAQSSKNIKEQFDSLKKTGISKSYFANKKINNINLLYLYLLYLLLEVKIMKNNIIYNF